MKILEKLPKAPHGSMTLTSICEICDMTPYVVEWIDRATKKLALIYVGTISLKVSECELVFNIAHEMVLRKYRMYDYHALMYNYGVIQMNLSVLHHYPVSDQETALQKLIENQRAMLAITESQIKIIRTIQAGYQPLPDYGPRLMSVVNALYALAC